MTVTTRTQVTGPNSLTGQIVVLTTGVDLVQPQPGLTTQRDANVDFNQRIEALEPLLTEIDGGIYDP